nr:MAG TPA: hypothetical protein [Caudoviricetes sp.]
MELSHFTVESAQSIKNAAGLLHFQTNAIAGLSLRDCEAVSSCGKSKVVYKI